MATVVIPDLIAARRERRLEAKKRAGHGHWSDWLAANVTVSDRTVDVHLSWLRRKLGETAAEPRYLHTVRGVGVKLVAPEQS